MTGEEYNKIKVEAGRELTKLMGVYRKMTELGVVGAVADALRQHPESISIARDAFRVISFVARADACRDLIAQDVNADGQGTCACLLHSMRLHEKDQTLNAWGCFALENIAENNPGNALMIVRAGGPAAILKAMHHAPHNHHFIACACQALGSLAISEAFSPDNIVDQQAIQFLLDVMQRNTQTESCLTITAQPEYADLSFEELRAQHYSQLAKPVLPRQPDAPVPSPPAPPSVTGSLPPLPSRWSCFEAACQALINIGTTHRNLLPSMKAAGAQQCLYNAMMLPGASARLKVLAPKFLDLLDGVTHADNNAPSARTLPVQLSASELLDLLDGVTHADNNAPSAPTLPVQLSASDVHGGVVEAALAFDSAQRPAAFCGRCGQRISSNNSFCTMCGAPVGR